MPTYEYRCDACGHEFELFQQMSDAVKRKCPSCGKARLQRLIGTGAGVIFKGGGFYETDYRSESYKKSEEAEKKAAEPKTDSKSDTAAKTPEKGETAPAKPETKAETETPRKPVAKKSASKPAKPTGTGKKSRK